MMRNLNRLWVRLALAFLLVTWAALGTVALLARYGTETNFRNYVSQQNAIRFGVENVANFEAYYAANGNWQGAESLFPGSGDGGGRNEQARRGAQFVVADPSGVVVVSTDPALVGTEMSETVLARAVSLTVDGETVGLLGQVTPGMQAADDAELRFLEQTTTWLSAAAIVAGLMAVIVAALLAWELTRPLRKLTRAVHDLSSGELGRQVDVGGSQEMVELTHAFNGMSQALAESEQLRQRMAADVAHELRTPVSVLRGRLEAMLDGVFPLDGPNLAVAYDQTIHIARLVDDLRLLTMAETGRLELARVRAAPGNLVTKAVELFLPLALDAGIALTQEIVPGLPDILVDVDRFQQIMGNLLSNALRHTPEEGEIVVRAWADGPRVCIAVSNTGKGLSPEEAAHIFERFWRAEESRERDRGGSGLGLAITQQLVQLHGGRIRVESDPDRVTFVVELLAA